MNIEQKQRFGELSEKVIEWANDRNIIKGATPVSQFAKLISEFGEFCRHAEIFSENTNSDKNPSGIPALKDDIGDQTVVIAIISAQLGARLVDSIDGLDLPANAPQDLCASLGGTYGHMADFVLKNQVDKFEKSATSALVELESAAVFLGSSLDECLAAAWEDIKDRKGVMYNGTFVKSTDAAYPVICAELGLEG